MEAALLTQIMCSCVAWLIAPNCSHEGSEINHSGLHPLLSEIDQFKDNEAEVRLFEEQVSKCFANVMCYIIIPLGVIVGAG